VIAYKFLRADGTSVFTDFRWPLPDGGPGPWVDAAIDPCRSGIHACLVTQLPLWAGRALYEIELDGDIVEEAMKVVAPRGRLRRRIETWDDAFRDEYTRMCADRAHELARGASRDAWDAVIEPSVPEGPALLGFVAARIAEEIAGPDAYAVERRRQAGWLRERLGL
jgi:Arc/MetJ family transcription regulator